MTDLAVIDRLVTATDQGESDNFDDVREQIQTFFKEYWQISVSCIYISKAYRTTFIVWLFLSYLKDHVRYAPILLIDATMLGCGKSTLQQFLAVMSGMCAEDRWSDFTKAGLKKIAGDQVIFMDEIDSVSKTDFLNAANFLNTSFESNGAQSVNAHGSAASFGFRCIAGINVAEKMQAPTLSRSIRVELKRIPSHLKLPKRFDELSLKHLYNLADEAKAYFENNAEKLQYYFEYAEYPQKAVLNQRFGDVWRDMFSLATLIGEECITKLMDSVALQGHLEDPVQFPKVEYFCTVRQYNDENTVQIYDGSDELVLDYSTNDFITGLKAVLDFHQRTVTIGIQTKELFQYIERLQIKDAPPTQRTLGRFMTELKFKNDKNVHKSSGYRFDTTYQTLEVGYPKAVNESLYTKYLNILEST